MGLTKLKRAFIQAWVSDPTISYTEAARRAGYSARRAKNTASELKKDVEVQNEISRQLAHRYKAQPVEGTVVGRQLTPESVLESLNDLREMCLRAGSGAWQCSTLLRIAELESDFLQMSKQNVVNPSSETPWPTSIKIVVVNPDGSAADWKNCRTADAQVLDSGTNEMAEESTQEALAPPPEPPQLPPPPPQPEAECPFHGTYSIPRIGAQVPCPTCLVEVAAYERKLQRMIPGGWA